MMKGENELHKVPVEALYKDLYRLYKELEEDNDRLRSRVLELQDKLSQRKRERKLLYAIIRKVAPHHSKEIFDQVAKLKNN